MVTWTTLRDRALNESISICVFQWMPLKHVYAFTWKYIGYFFKLTLPPLFLSFPNVLLLPHFHARVQGIIQVSYRDYRVSGEIPGKQGTWVKTSEPQPVSPFFLYELNKLYNFLQVWRLRIPRAFLRKQSFNIKDRSIPILFALLFSGWVSNLSVK